MDVVADSALASIGAEDERYGITHLAESDDAWPLRKHVRKDGKGGKGAAATGNSSSSVGGKPWHDRETSIFKVPAGDVASKMGFARTGSDVPSDFHGIHWLDQKWASSIAKDPSWASELPLKHPASAEILAAFGDWPTAWNAQTKTLGPVPNGGGAMGHWAYLETGEFQLNGAASANMFANFVFESDSHIAVDARVMLLGVEIPIPKALFQMQMRKRPWGWARVTTIGPNFFGHLPEVFQNALRKVLPEDLTKILDLGTKGAFQYPVLQIVDGNGDPTRYFQEYMDFVKTQVLLGKYVAEGVNTRGIADDPGIMDMDTLGQVAIAKRTDLWRTLAHADPAAPQMSKLQVAKKLDVESCKESELVIPTCDHLSAALRNHKSGVGVLCWSGCRGECPATGSLHALAVSSSDGCTIPGQKHVLCAGKE